MSVASFTCPICGFTSHNPNDARERYCGRCHAFVDDPARFLTLGLMNEDGWYGSFTRARYPGAMANDTRVVKIETESGDIHPLGACATVLGSIGHPDVGVAYFVEWDEHPRVAALVTAYKVRAQ